MSKSVEEVRRAAFEAACPVPYYITWNVDRSGYYSIHRDSARKRGAGRYEEKWQVFNAALDAVEIDMSGVDEYDGWQAVDSCRAAIEQTGLGLRVK